MLLLKSIVVVSIVYVLCSFCYAHGSGKFEGDVSSSGKQKNQNEVKRVKDKPVPLVVLTNGTGKASHRKSLDNLDLRAPDSSHDLMILNTPDIDSYLFVSTLDGGFHAIGRHTGDVQWVMRGEPVLRAPLDLPGSGRFLPDPRDGSLYVYYDRFTGLRKLPFTIPELVAASPSRSNDGILYTGSKKDIWYAVDPHTGFRQQVLNNEEEVEDICPSPSGKTVLLGRTQYSITMFDTKIKEKTWNVTFMDYSTHSQTGHSDLIYFASCSEGIVVTLEPQSADVLWVRNFHSPVVAMYSIENDALVKLPFTTVAPETLRHLAAGVSSNVRKDFIHGKNTNNFFATLYIGEHKHSLYALPSIVDEQLASRGMTRERLQIEGPSDGKPKKKPRQGTSSIASLIFGFHRPPKEMISRVPVDHLLENHSSELIEPTSPPPNNQDDNIPPSVDHSQKFLERKEPVNSPMTIQIDVKVLCAFLAGVFGFVIFVVYSARRQIREVSQRSNLSELSHDSHSIQTSISLQGPYEDLVFGKGFMRIGKIVFDTKNILGHGCEGTIVYRGKFDGRDVAVKRLLPECYSLADREVELLRESDLSHHVIRYFCMEQDNQFRYIALELCMMTVHDYIEKDQSDTVSIKPVDILKQAMSGLAHLHHLHIVHRDVKPQNVLISLPDSRGNVRALISDFGLCKKLGGRRSLSRRSGIAGTEGWMAPEQLNLEERTSTFMDIFSAGCVVYYVLSKGSHPFGDKIHRQSNILRGEFNLLCLDCSKDAEAYDLVSSMIQYDSRLRPTADAVLKHPFFWTADQALGFYSDVSDRIEKEPIECKVLEVLERKSGAIVREDWRAHISVELQYDLRKFRSYRGNSVRDLLRALRNKKHHFRECAEDVQKALGFTSEEFYHYFNSRFPLLLMHTYNSLKCCCRENAFEKYYDIRQTFDSCPGCADVLCYTHGVFGFDSGLCCVKPPEVPKGSPRPERRQVDDECTNPRAEALLGKPLSIFDDSPKKARNARHRHHRRRNTGQTVTNSDT